MIEIIENIRLLVCSRFTKLSVLLLNNINNPLFCNSEQATVRNREVLKSLGQLQRGRLVLKQI
jgi:hypothetical protein